MSQLSHAQFPLRRHPNLLVDHRRSRSAAVAEPRGANGEAVTGSGGRLHFGMVAGIKSERWPTSNRNPRPDCLGIRSHAWGSCSLAGWNRPPQVTRSMDLTDTQLKYFVENRLKLPKGKRAEYLAQVDHLIERFAAAAK